MIKCCKGDYCRQTMQLKTFYSGTGICIPPPLTSTERSVCASLPPLTSTESFDGYHHSFSLMIILNFLLFLLIAVGQAFIYWSVRSRKQSTRKNYSTEITCM